MSGTFPIATAKFETMGFSSKQNTISSKSIGEDIVITSVQAVIDGMNRLLLKKILKQISGSLPEDEELIPEVAILGSGEMWCWDPSGRTHKKIYRGVKAFILYENYDKLGRTLIYTLAGDMICIEPEELLHTGFD